MNVPAEHVQTDVAQTENTPEATRQPTLQDVDRKYFAPDSLESGQQYINSVLEICEAAGIEAVFNFDTDAHFPDDYGLAVIPITKRVADEGNVIRGICIAAIPSVDLILSNDSGKSYANKLIQDSLIRKVASEAKPKDDGSLTTLSFKIEDFTTTSRSGGLAAFNSIASAYVKILREKGLKFMSKALLRNVLQSASFAEQQFPRLEQKNWEVVLNSMVQHVIKEGVDAGVLQHWLATRNSVEVALEDIDLTDIDEMV